MTAGVRAPTRIGVIGLVLLVLAGTVLAACGNGGGPLATRVSNWASSTGIVAQDGTVAGDIKDVEGSYFAGKTLTMKTLCGVLEEDTSAAYVDLPSPDGAVTAQLNDAFTALGAGANDCYSSATTGDKAKIDKSLAEIQAGSQHLTAATRLLRAVGVN